jgi:biopolymer transport protein ExbB/TolQ
MATRITVVCQKCRGIFPASSNYIGRQAKCPACGNLIEIRPMEDRGPSVPPPVPVRSQPQRSTEATDVPAWQPGLIAGAATVLWFLFLFAFLRSTHFGDLFLARGFIPFVIMFVTFWGLALLGLKYYAVFRQASYAEKELELIPLDLGLQITPANVDQFIANLDRLPADQRQSILARRIQGALEHFKSQTSVPEVRDYLASQAEIDSSAVDSGYILLRAFIWVVPILGFIGTVLGIGDAVGDLSNALNPAEPARAVAVAAAPAEGGMGEQLRTGMKGVVSGLSTAFDTTFLALVMAIVLLFPTEWLRKKEYGMLDRIQAFTNDSLLRRLAGGGQGSEEAMPEQVRKILDPLFKEHQRWLAEWQAQVGALGQQIGGSFEVTISTIHQQIAAAQKESWEQVHQARKAVEELFQAVDHQSGGAARNLNEALRSAGKLQEAVTQTTKLLTALAEQQARLAASQQPSSVVQEIRQLSREVATLSERWNGAVRRAGEASQGGWLSWWRGK